MTLTASCPKCTDRIVAGNALDLTALIAEHFIRKHECDVATAQARAEEVMEDGTMTTETAAPAAAATAMCNYCKRKDGTHTPGCARRIKKPVKRPFVVRTAARPAPSQTMIEKMVGELRDKRAAIDAAIKALEALGR